MAAFLDDKAILTSAFNSMDKDGDGFLDHFEIHAVFTSYYNTKLEKGNKLDYEKLTTKVMKFMRKVDKNGDGKISLSEFIDYFMNLD
jgi:Ca2+-binding EF-hand superfamily protein